MLQNKIRFLLSATAIMALIATVAYLSLLLFPPVALAADAETVVDPGVLRWGYMAAALATGLSALAAGIAVGGVGAAAIGAIAEKPDLFGRTLVFVGLAEGIAIYGLIISIMILNRLG
ncbi:MAG: ATP synthase subunit C [Gammaproteobacteria bacterium]|nr:ATP synthase subunit C [Gammaproteobacteria bacterium]MDH3858600.1 ATP synthase subunit C [Gammaproteobacteria bacterium]